MIDYSVIFYSSVSQFQMIRNGLQIVKPKILIEEKLPNTICFVFINQIYLLLLKPHVYTCKEFFKGIKIQLILINMLLCLAIYKAFLTITFCKLM